MDIVELEKLAASTAPGEQMTVDPDVILDLTHRLQAAEAALHTIGRSVVTALEFAGQVMVVERIPRQPLAMGNHRPFVTFRPARRRA